MGTRLGDRLSAAALATIRAGVPVVVHVASSGPAGPDCAPVSLVWPAGPDRMLLGMAASRTTVANVRAGSRVALSVAVPPRLALTVSGEARVVVEEMEAAGHVCAVEVLIDGVEDDMHPAAELGTGLSYRWRDAERALVDAELLEELRRIGDRAG